MSRFASPTSQNSNIFTLFNKTFAPTHKYEYKRVFFFKYLMLKCEFFSSQVNNVSVAPEALPMSDYPEKLRGSRSHLDDESTNYDKPPYNYTPQ